MYTLNTKVIYTLVMVPTVGTTFEIIYPFSFIFFKKNLLITPLDPVIKLNTLCMSKLVVTP